MQIADKTVVSFHYTLSGSDGEEIESSRDGDPTSYLHGARNIIPGLEQAMTGRAEGDSFEVTLAPADAYGERRDGLSQKVPVKHLSYQGKLRPGSVAQLNTEQGKVAVTVTKVGRHSATVDANHPLAGRELCFAIEITGVREASAEEIDHGHAHGVGGHQH